MVFLLRHQMNSDAKAAVKGLCICQKLRRSQELTLMAPWENWTPIGWFVLSERRNILGLCDKILIPYCL